MFDCTDCSESTEKLVEMQDHYHQEHSRRQLRLEECRDCGGEDDSCYICNGKGYRKL